ncbi:DUF7523 family protein [Halomarina litorea]|uniref:DUF7523 family protein n=1 Tax=Halomarina litorea TaxID=2961595 RepID=UPI0020C27753|nr:hypothetical protein [Halomarina sp. BCD28]
MSLAAAARDAVRARPFLHDALRAGVVNYAAAARLLAEESDALADADEETVTAALRRFAGELDEYEPPRGDARVSMKSGLGPVESNGADESDDSLLRVGGTTLADGGSLTGILASGTVDAPLLANVVGRLEAADVPATAAGVAGDSLLVVVERRDGPTALRIVEDVL